MDSVYPPRLVPLADPRPNSGAPEAGRPALLISNPGPSLSLALFTYLCTVQYKILCLVLLCRAYYLRTYVVVHISPGHESKTKGRSKTRLQQGCRTVVAHAVGMLLTALPRRRSQQGMLAALLCGSGLLLDHLRP